MLFTQREYHTDEGLLIKYYRLLADLSQAELEEKCQFKPGVISCAEKGQDIKRKKRIKIACALNMEPLELTVLPDNWKTEPVAEVEKLHLDFKNKRSANRRARTGKLKKKNTKRKVIHKEEFGGYF